MDEKNKNYKKSFFYTFLIFGILVEAITITIIFGLNYFNIKEQIGQRYSLEKMDKINLIQFIIKQSQNSIDGIINSKAFKSYVLKQNEQNTHVMKDLFHYILGENKNYMQVRYLDKFGQENLRAQRIDNKISLVDDKELQNKSKRYYFKQTMQTKNGTFWHSDIDLNIENGKIEIPYKPTFRVAKKIVYDSEEKGIIIINIAMEDILKRLAESWNFDIYLVDGSGYIVYASENEKSWARDLKKKNDFFQNNDIKKKNITKKSYKQDDMFIENLSNVILSKEKIYLVFKNKGIMIENIKRSNYYATLWVMFLVFLISIPLAFIISNVPSNLYDKLRQSLIKIKEFSFIIDKYVMSLSVDKDGNIKETSTAFMQKVNYDKSEIIGQKHHDILSHAVGNEEHDTTLKNGEMLAKDKNGVSFWVEQTISPLKSPKGELKGYASILFDITEQKEVKKQALTDYLTSLANRRYLNEALEREIELSKRYKTNFSIIMLDIDFFKKINDECGHICGDKILQEMAIIMTKSVRNTDVVGRFGGEEFMIILPYTEIEGAIITAENLRKEVENYKFSCDCLVTASFGVTVFKSEDDLANLVKRADEALYKAKNSGRNKVISS